MAAIIDTVHVNMIHSDTNGRLRMTAARITHNCEVVSATELQAMKAYRGVDVKLHLF